MGAPAVARLVLTHLLFTFPRHVVRNAGSSLLIGVCYFIVGIGAFVA